MKPATPTQALYGQLEAAFNFFNERLFGGQLPPCLTTLISAKHAYFYHQGAALFSHKAVWWISARGKRSPETL
ncbi:MAG: hypothetical protein ACOVLL_00755 [Hydrogenophaga sp.]